MLKLFMPKFLFLALGLAITVLASGQSTAAVMTKRVKSDIAGIDLIISCDVGPIAKDYVAQTASGVPLTDPYALARGADKGLVTLMNEGRRQAQHYVIPHENIRAIVRVIYAMDVLERADLVFTPAKLILIETSQRSAGIFIGSDVYELPLNQSGEVDKTLVKANPDLMRLLDVGLAAYQPGAGICGAR
jgi:hypothetical protein